MSSFKQQKGSYGNRQANNETNTPPSYYNFVTQANQLQYLQTQNISTQPLTLQEIPQIPQIPHHFPNSIPSLPSEYISIQNLTTIPQQTNLPSQKPQSVREIKIQHYLRKKRLKKLLLNDELKNLS